MTMVTGQFDRVADSVVARTAELLATDVSVVDDRGVTLASTDPDLVGLPFDLVQPNSASRSLRVPLRLDSHEGQVVIGIPTTGEVLPPRLVQALVELVINQAAVLEQIPKRHELKDKFIHDLLRGQIGDEGDVQREAQILGMDFTRPRAVILIDSAEFILGADGLDRPEVSEVQRRRRAQLVIASVVGFFALPDDTICAYIGDGDVAVLKASSTQDLEAWTDDDSPEQPAASWANLSALKRAADALLARLRRDTGANVTIGIGRYHPGIRGLAHSYQDARAALSLGRRFHGQNRAHCLDGLGMAAFVGVADERTKIDLARHLLSPLDHAADLLETLDVYFAEDCCPSTAAARLAIHRNTLSYRLDKVALLTGLDPRRFDDAVQIRLALLVRALRCAAA